MGCCHRQLAVCGDRRMASCSQSSESSFLRSQLLCSYWTSKAGLEEFCNLIFLFAGECFLETTFRALWGSNHHQIHGTGITGVTLTLTDRPGLDNRAGVFSRTTRGPASAPAPPRWWAYAGGILSWALVICFSSLYLALTRSHSFLFWCKFINGFKVINSMTHTDHSRCVFSDRMCSSLDPVVALSVFSAMRWKPSLTSFQDLQFIGDLILPCSPPLHPILLNSHHTATWGGNWKTIKAESLLEELISVASKLEFG